MSSLKHMIISPDKENVYLAVKSLRNDKGIRDRKELLSKIPIIDRIHDMDDIADELDININDYILFKDEGYLNSYQRYMNACSLIPKIVRAYNEQEDLDWDNTNIYKYLPYYKKDGSGWVFRDSLSWCRATYGSVAHHYKSRELSEDGCSKFNNIYVDYFSYKG